MLHRPPHGSLLDLLHGENQFNHGEKAQSYLHICTRSNRAVGSPAIPSCLDSPLSLEKRDNVLHLIVISIRSISILNLFLIGFRMCLIYTQV
jgi:hypothetical protein